MEAGQSGAVIEILGGHGLVRRLEAMGIRPGKKITKVSSTFLRGPVTFKVDHTQIAIGFGMANKIVVEVDNPG
ncbi:MAG: ferrous iron transport protein A [Chloroflexi bacterium]|nr:ferrous iron transport protein A [Chloroflexota bacterium]MBM3172311.1 ferrous iron transport protein A [Chloroflexota bacterium]MBM3174679.1 ferrous iron transport protein A [Chloroflexota bacterium]MBM4450089.1 ferrous iron transport protein A [Chloroflexota bacterium]